MVYLVRKGRLRFKSMPVHEIHWVILDQSFSRNPMTRVELSGAFSSLLFCLNPPQIPYGNPLGLIGEAAVGEGKCPKLSYSCVCGSNFCLHKVSLGSHHYLSD